MTWEASTTPVPTPDDVLTQEVLDRSRLFDRWRALDHRRDGVMARHGFNGGWDAAKKWVRDQFDAWEDFTVGEALLELRKGRESLFFPLFRHDPTLWADCPEDGRVVITVEGYCDACGFDFGREQH